MTVYKEIKISEIEIGADRSRQLDPNWAMVISRSIKEVGLISDILVRPTENGYKLIAGLTRVAAYEILGRDKIPAKIREFKGGNESHYRLEELSENVIRNELTALDRARSLCEMYGIYQGMYPELKQGGNKQTEEAKHNLTAILAIRSELLEKVGLSERAFRRATAIWKGLSVASRARIYGTWLAKHQAGLMAIADQTPANQKKLLNILFPKTGEPTALNMPDALCILEHGRLLDQRESSFDRVLKVTKTLKPKELELVFEAHEEQIMAWLKGRTQT